MAYDPKVRAKMARDRLLDPIRKRRAAEYQRIADVSLRQPPSPEWLADLRGTYAKLWAETADEHAQHGHYAWMAEQLPVRGRVLEIGCGNGQSSLALVRSGQTVLAVDENPVCVEKAMELLATNGVPFDVERREAVTFTGGKYVIDYSPPTVAPFAKAVTLLEGDTLADEDLLRWISTVGPFDAVVCWLVGSHSGRHANRGLSKFEFTNATHYRLKTENLIYELADGVLRPGGYLHIVDRGEAPTSPMLLNDAIQAHRDQASVTSLEVQGLTYQRYDPETLATAMEFMPGLSGRVPKKFRPALVSILAQKPQAQVAAAG